MDRNLRIRMLLEAGDRVTRPLRDIAGGSSRAAEALKATRDRLKEIDRAQADIAGFRQLKAGVRSTEQQMQAAQSRVHQLAREMAQAETPSRELTRSFNRARQEAQQLTRQHAQEAQELQRLRDRMRAAGISTNDLARHERELREQSSRANEELEEQRRRLEELNERQQRLARARASFDRVQGRANALAGGGLATLGTGVAMGRGILGGVKEAQTYESVMTSIAQKANLSREDARKMGVNLLLAARAANQLPDELQGGIDTLSGFGLDPRQAVQMIAPIGRAATAYKAEITDLSAASFAAHDNLKVALSDIPKVLDAMASADNDGAFAMKDMAQYFPSLTAGYQALGQHGVSAVADLAAALQIARKGAGDAAAAGTNVANVIQKISSPATIKAFSKFGVDLPAALKKAYREGKTPLEAIAELTSKTLKGDLGKIGFLFEDAQVQQGLRPLIQNMEEYRRIRANATGASGNTDRAFAERMKDSAELTKQLEINAKTLGITMGTLLLPTVNAVAQKANAWANWLGNLAQRHPVLTKYVVMFAAGMSALLVILGAGAIAIAGIMGPIAILNAGLIALGVAGGTASIGLLPIIGTVAAVVAGVALLGGAAYLLYRYWDPISKFFSGLWSDVKTAFDGGLLGVIALLWNWNARALATFGRIASAIAGALPSLFSNVWAVLKFVFWNALMLLPRLAYEFGVNTVRGLISGIKNMLPALKSTVVGAASSAATWFKQKLGIHSPSRVFMEFGGHIMSGLANGIAGSEDAPIRRLDGLSRKMAAAIAVGAALGPVPSSGMPRSTTASTGTAAAGARGDRYEIHLHAAPGMDEAKLMKLLEQKLKELQRQRDARSRSSFADHQDWDDYA